MLLTTQIGGLTSAAILYAGAYWQIISWNVSGWGAPEESNEAKSGAGVEQVGQKLARN